MVIACYAVFSGFTLSGGVLPVSYAVCSWAGLRVREEPPVGGLRARVGGCLRRYHRRGHLSSGALGTCHVSLRRFCTVFSYESISSVAPSLLRGCVNDLRRGCGPGAMGEGVTSIGTLFRCLRCGRVVTQGPFGGIRVGFHRPIVLPGAVPLRAVRVFLSAVCRRHAITGASCREGGTLQSTTIVRLLFTAKVQVSRLYTLHVYSVSLCSKSILVCKGNSGRQVIRVKGRRIVRVLSRCHGRFLPRVRAYRRFFTALGKATLSSRSMQQVVGGCTSLTTVRRRVAPRVFQRAFTADLLRTSISVHCVRRVLNRDSVRVARVCARITVSGRHTVLAAERPHGAFRLWGTGRRFAYRTQGYYR